MDGNVQEGAPTEPQFRYWAFISYSQRDRQWANWLFRALETYAIPRKVVGQDAAGAAIPKRLFPLFRDREELPGASDLGAKLADALKQSRSLIVICSPNAAHSRWVNEEVKSYKALGREDRVLALIVDGEPNASDDPARAAEECFPEALRFRVGADRGVTSLRVEPIGADARPNKDGKRNSLLKLVAGILGLGLDVLKQRDQERRMRRMMVIGAVLATLVVVFAGLAYYANAQRLSSEARRRMTLAQKLSTQSEAELARGGDGLELGSLLALESLRSAWTPEAYDLLLRQSTLLAGPPQKRWRAHDRFGIRYLVTNPRRGWLVTASDDEDAIWSLADGSLIRRFPADKPGDVMRPAVSPDGRWLALQCGRGLCVRDTATWQEVFRLAGGELGTFAGLSGDGSRLGVTSFGSHQVDLFTTSGWTKDRTIDHGEQISAFAFSPEGSLLATAGQSRLTLWDAASGRRLAETQSHGPQTLVFSPDGRRVAGGEPQTKLDSSWSTRADGMRIQLWDVLPDGSGAFRLEPRRTLQAETRDSAVGISAALAFSRSGRFLATTGSVLDTESGAELGLSLPHGQSAAAFGATDRAWILGDESGTVEVRAFDAKEAFQLARTPEPRAVDFSPSGIYVALGGGDGSVRVLAVDGWRSVARFALPEAVSAVAFSPDGRWLAAVGEKVAITLDTAGWKPRSRIEHEDAITASGFDSAGRILVTSTGRAVGLSLLDRGISHILAHDGNVAGSMTFSGDGGRLWTATEPEYNRRVGLAKPAVSYLWETASGKRLAAVQGGRESTAADGQQVTLQSHPHAVAAKGPWKENETLQGSDLFARQIAEAKQVHGGDLVDQAVSADGRWLATIGADDSVRLWPFEMEDLAQTICARLTRNFTRDEWRKLHVDDGPRRRTCPRLP